MKERGVVDLECGKSFRDMGGITQLTRDALRCPRCGKLLFPNAAPGTFDFRVALPVWSECKMHWLAVECKYGKSSLPFDSFDDKKRLWAEKHILDYEMWVWMCLGTNIRAQKPRTTWLFPYALFLKMEKRFDRKSIPYDCDDLEQYKLPWVGKGLWRITWVK